MSRHTNVPCALKEINSQLCALLLNATAFMSILLFYLPCRLWNHCKLTLEVDLMPVQVCLWCVPVLLQVCTWYAAICWSVGLHLTAEGVARDREDATGGWRERDRGHRKNGVCVYSGVREAWRVVLAGPVLHLEEIASLAQHSPLLSAVISMATSNLADVMHNTLKLNSAVRVFFVSFSLPLMSGSESAGNS